MSPLEPLAPDQRAVVALVLQQGRSYDEIAALLGMPVAAVRARAQAGLASLARDNGLPEAITAPLADYLLGQQQPPDAEATRGLLAESAAARSWAADVAASLEDVAPRGLPEVPAAAPKPAPSGTAKSASSAAAKSPSSDTAKSASSTTPNRASSAAAKPPSPAAAKPPSSAAATSAGSPVPGPRPRPVRESSPPAADDSPPAASRLGGVVLIAVVLAVVAVVLYVVLSGGDDPGDEQAASSPSPAASAAPTPTATPQVADSISLRSTTGSNAKGTMTLFLQDGQLLFALEAQDVPPSGGRATYAVWFTGPGGKARRLGFTNPVGNDGRLGIQGPSEKDLEQFPQLYATHERVVVSRETSENAKRPTRVILSGRLPQGR